MAVTEADINEMLAFLVTHPEYQDRFRAVVVGNEIPSRLDRIEATLERMVERQDHTEAALDRLTERVDRLTERVDALAESQLRTEAALQKLNDRFELYATVTDSRLNRLEGRMGNVEGDLLETRYRNNITNWFTRHVRNPALTTVDRLPFAVDALERGLIAPLQFDRLRDLDFIIEGVDSKTGEMVILAVEVSSKIFQADIERAIDRAGTLAKAGYTARPFVGGYEIDPNVSDTARDNGVIVDLIRR